MSENDFNINKIIFCYISKLQQIPGTISHLLNHTHRNAFKKLFELSGVFSIQLQINNNSSLVLEFSVKIQDKISMIM